jgi:two-component system OmpR family response regulator
MLSPETPARVAIVDDEEDITTFLALALEDAGFVVAVTNDPAQALELLRDFRPDLICLDLLMPGQTGASLYLEIHADRSLSHVPVMILSGLDAREDLRVMLQRRGGAPPPSGYIEKPVSAPDFVRSVQTLLERTGGVSPEEAT